MTPESALRLRRAPHFHLGAAASPHSHAEYARQLCETSGVAAQANVRRSASLTAPRLDPGSGSIASCALPRIFERKTDDRLENVSTQCFIERAPGTREHSTTDRDEADLRRNAAARPDPILDCSMYNETGEHQDIDRTAEHGHRTNCCSPTNNRRPLVVHTPASGGD